MKQFITQFKHFLAAWLMVLSVPAIGQSTAPMRGTVLDETGQPLVGVTILIKETGQDSNQGTTTDAKGAFTFQNLRANASYTITASYIGYKKKTIQNFSINARDNNSIMIRLEAEQQSLNDVVVIGYGAQSKAKVTGVISQVKGQELNRYAGSSFAQQLAGKAAGVVINDPSAQPGTDPQIVIRGIGTLTAGRNPLIVVDGFPLSEGSSLNSINPQDIESLDILKDPSSAAIYGSRAANGVVLITTKKGKSEKMTVTLDVYTGFQQRADKVKHIDAYQAAEYFTEARDWGYISKDPAGRSINDDRATRLKKGASLRQLRLSYMDPWLNKQPGLTNTDWLDELFRSGKMSSYNLAFSGGSEKTRYYVSANYFNQEGIVLNNGLKRYSAAIKLDSKLSKKVDLGISINPSYNAQTYFNNNANWSNDPIANMYIMYPMFSPYNADGSLAISTQIKANLPEDGALAENPVALALKNKNERTFFRTFGNTYLSFQPIEGLTLKSMLGGDVQSALFDEYSPSDVGGYRTAAPKPASAQENRIFNINYLTENTIAYNKQLGNHQMDLLAGYTFQQEQGSTTTVTGTDIADNNIDNIGGASSFRAVADRYTWTQISYLARAQYSFRNKYLFTALLRRDGSSRFGDNRKWGNFPSLTAGWIVSNEDFFPKGGILNFAKLRASWGQSGNNQIGSYSSQALVNPANYVFGNTLGTGFAATTVANPDLSWETKTATNVGLDFGFYKHFNISADYYHSVTKDLLLNVPVPEQSGFSSSIQNIGKIQNRGFELELTGNSIKLGPVQWSFSGNIATNQNKVLALAPGQQEIIASNQFLTRVGGPIAQLYGYQVTGIFKTQQQLDNTPHLPGTMLGDYELADINGDGSVNLSDRKTFGTYNPKLTYGFSSNFAYSNFDLSFSLNGIQGRKLYDEQLALHEESGEGFGVPNIYYFKNRYHPINNPDGFLAQGNLGNPSSARQQGRLSSIVYKNADYLRLRNLQIGYTLPRALISRIGLASARVYLSGNNLFTATSFLGFNPDATTTGNVLTNGYSRANYPVARSYTAGVSVSF